MRQEEEGQGAMRREGEQGPMRADEEGRGAMRQEVGGQGAIWQEEGGKGAIRQDPVGFVQPTQRPHACFQLRSLKVWFMVIVESA